MSVKHFCQVLLVAGALLPGCAAEQPDAPVSRDVAEQIARQQLARSHVTGVKQIVDHGRFVFKVLVQNDSTAKRITVDAATARVIEVVDRTEALRQAIADGANVAEPVCPSARGAAEAKALQAVPGTLKRWKVLKDNDRVVHRFDIATAAEDVARVTVDAGTQEILEIAPLLPAR